MSHQLIDNVSEEVEIKEYFIAKENSFNKQKIVISLLDEQLTEEEQKIVDDAEEELDTVKNGYTRGGILGAFKNMVKTLDTKISNIFNPEKVKKLKLPDDFLTRTVIPVNKLLEMEEKELMFISTFIEMHQTLKLTLVYRPEVKLENIMYVIDKVRTEHGFNCTDVTKNKSGYNSIKITSSTDKNYEIEDNVSEICDILFRVYLQRLYYMRGYKNFTENIEFMSDYPSTNEFLKKLGYMVTRINSYKILVSVPTI